MNLKKPLVLCLAVLCAQSALAQSMSAPTVMARTATTVTESEERTYIGTVKAAETVNITAKINGTLWKAAFKEGSIVKKGDLLFEIEDTIYKANLEIAQAGLKQVQAEYDHAISEFNRNKTLYDKKVISASEFSNYVKVKDTLAAKIIEVKANIKLCENNLSYTKITSPITGRIGENIISVGNEIGPASGKLATIVQFDPIKIRFSMAEADFYQNFEDGKLIDHTMTVLNADGKPLAGDIKIDFFDNQVDQETNTVMIQMLCPNPKNELLPGGIVKIVFKKKYDKPQLALPISALMTDGHQHYIYIVKEDKVEKRIVKTGDQVGDVQIILDGLKDDELVITGGGHKTQPGGTVRLAK